MYDDYPQVPDETRFGTVKGETSPNSALQLVAELPSTYMSANRKRPVVRTIEDFDFESTTAEGYFSHGQALSTLASKHEGKKRKKRRRYEQPYISTEKPHMPIVRSTSFHNLAANQRDRYWNITSNSVEYMIDTIIDYLGGRSLRTKTKTIVQFALWRRYSSILERQRSCEKRIESRKLNGHTRSSRPSHVSTTTQPIVHDLEPEDGFSRWSGVQPRSIAESIVLDKLKQIFKCSSLNREASANSRNNHIRPKPISNQTIVTSKPFFTDDIPFYGNTERVVKKRPVDPRIRTDRPSAPVDPRKRITMVNDTYMHYTSAPTYLPSKSTSNTKRHSKKKSPPASSNYTNLDQTLSPIKSTKHGRSDSSTRRMSYSHSNAAYGVYKPPAHSHVTGISRSLPENWKWRRLDHAIKPIRPFDGMSVEQIEEHLRSLKIEGRVKKFRRYSLLLQRLMDHARNCNQVFNSPVDPVALNLPTYTSIIKNPMDLGTVKKRLDAAWYVAADDFADDVRLVFENAKKFNSENHWVHVNANILLEYFNESWGVEFERTLQEDVKAATHSCESCCGNICIACNQGCLELTLPFYQCFGNCGATFRKGNTYYVTRDGTRMWCLKCRNKSVKEEKILHEDNESYQNQVKLKRNILPTASEVSAWLLKKKCEVDVEPWVKCSVCANWMHQVCVLFNPVEDAYDTANHFVCPECQLKSRRLCSIPPSFLDCTSLPESELSQFLEASLHDVAGDAVDSLCVRTMTYTTHTSHLPNAAVDMFQTNASLLRESFPGYAHQAMDVPSKLSHGTKTIFLFQKQHGVDVCLFAMYVQEYNDTTEYAPNRRSAYLAYIDSVRYMEPASIRTAVYHTLLMAYFDYIRRQGIEKVYIWSCPPQRSQSYVFWCHPHFQKTPGVEHLRAWYKSVLNKAQNRGIISSWGTLFDRRFADYLNQLKKDSKPDPILVAKQAAVATRRCSTTALDPELFIWPEAIPLFDGDFIPGELDRIARSMKTKSKSRKDGLQHEPVYLKDAFQSFLTAMKAMKDDLLEVDLEPFDGPIIQARDPPTKLPGYVGSRFAYHQMSSHASYQFDSLRRAKHSTMMLLHQMINASVPQCNTFCHECALLITHADHWYCRTCPHFSLCDWCHAHYGPEHSHTLYRGLDDDEGVPIKSI